MSINTNGKKKEEKINEITDLNKLKKYLCPLHNYNPWSCLECAKPCLAGKQAINLLEVETQPTNETNVNIRTEKVRTKLRSALMSNNPVEWLLQNGVPSRHAANEFLRKATQKHPDIVLEANRRKTTIEAEKNAKIETETALLSKRENKEANISDEELISIEDFLNEVDNNETMTASSVHSPTKADPSEEEYIPNNANKKTYDSIAKETEARKSHDTGNEKDILSMKTQNYDEINIVISNLDKKWKLIEEERSKLEEEYKKLLERVAECEKNITHVCEEQEAINKVIEMFQK